MAANLLWAHLLRKDATVSDTPSQIPVVVAPQDKTSTSMRMLIHDTQANLETFSTRLDGLLQRVDECRVQVVNANKLLDVERDRVLAEILELANRCQSELKTHIGTPAQASALDLVRVSQVSTEHAVQALEKRIDALQTLLQTHTHAMQSIQDQQNTLIGTLLPLVPVIHGVTPQMDQIKTVLSDLIANAVATMTTRVENIESKLVAQLAHGRAEAESSTRMGSLNKSGSRRKRLDPSILGPRGIDDPVSSPLDSRSHGGLRRSFKRPRAEGMAHSAENAEFPRKLSRLGPPSIDALSRRPQTPRRPLADLPLPPLTNPSPVARRSNSTLREYMRPFETLRPVADPSSIMTPQSRTPFGPLEDVLPNMQDQRQHVNKTAVRLPNAAGSSTEDALSKAIKIEEILEPIRLSGIISVHSSPLSSLPSSSPRWYQNEKSVNVAPEENTPADEIVEIPPPMSEPKSMSLRDRRAQISMFRRTETRRFLPLVPWSDDEE